MIFKPYFIYELRPEIKLKFHKVLCLTARAHGRKPTQNAITFLPLSDRIPPFQDPFRVRVEPAPKGLARLPRPFVAVIDAAQTLPRAAFQQNLDYGQVTDVEERDIRAALNDFLDIAVAETSQ